MSLGTKIQHGDVFIKKVGNRELVRVFVPGLAHVAKLQFMRLYGGSLDSTWLSTREEMEELPHRMGNKWQYIGTVPPDRLEYLRYNWTLR